MLVPPSQFGYNGVQLGLRYDWHNKHHGVPHSSLVEVQPVGFFVKVCQDSCTRILLFEFLEGLLLLLASGKWFSLARNLPKWVSGSSKIRHESDTELNPTKPRKLRTSDGDSGWLASTTTLTFSSVGPIQCLVKGSPMKTTFVIRKVHFSAFRSNSFLEASPSP